VAVASAGPYASLHLASDRDNHASTPPLSFFAGRMPFLLPNQQHQSTEGKQTWNWVAFCYPGIQRPGDPVDPVTLFYNELQLSTYVADRRLQLARGVPVFTARCYASTVLAMDLCLCLSVTSRSSTKTAKHRIPHTTPHDTPGTLVF